MLIHAQLTEKLKEELQKVIHQSFENQSIEIDDFFSLLLLAGNDDFYPHLSPSALSEDNELNLLPFARILVTYQEKYPYDPELQELRAKYNQPFDTSVLNEDCKRLLQKVGDETLYDAVALKMEKKAIVDSSDERSHRNRASLLALSFLPDDYVFALKIQQLATADHHVLMHPEIELALNNFLGAIRTRSEQEKEETLTPEEEQKIKINFNSFYFRIHKINKKISVGQTKISIKELESAAILLKELDDTEETETALQNLIKTVQRLIDFNEKNSSPQDRKTVKKQLRKGKQFIQDTNYFREHVADYSTIYLNLTDETQKQDFERFIDIIYHIDRDFLVYGKAPDLGLLESAFSSFQKIIDPSYHQLTAHEISLLQWKKEIWTALNFLTAATLTACIATVVVLQPFAVFFPIFVITLLLMLNAAITKEFLHDEPQKALVENETSQAQITFKTGYSDHLFTLFPKTNKNIEGKATALANWHRQTV